MCAADDALPAERTVYQWLSKHAEFAQKYARAREAWADAEFESMLHDASTPLIGTKVTEKGDGTIETVTGDAVDRARLSIDTRKWALAHMNPKKYGVKTSHEFSGHLNTGGPLTPEQIVTALNALEQKAEEVPGGDLV